MDPTLIAAISGALSPIAKAGLDKLLAQKPKKDDIIIFLLSQMLGTLNNIDTNVKNLQAPLGRAAATVEVLKREMNALDKNLGDIRSQIDQVRIDLQPVLDKVLSP